jgi:hypothetical protein
LNKYCDFFGDGNIVSMILRELHSKAKFVAPDLWLLNIMVVFGYLFGRFYEGYEGGNLNLYGVGIADTGRGKDASKRYFEILFALLNGEKYRVTGVTLGHAAGLYKQAVCEQNLLYFIDELGLCFSRVKARGGQVSEFLMTAWSSRNHVLPSSSYQTSQKISGAEIYGLNLNIYGVTAAAGLRELIAKKSFSTGELNRYIWLPDRNIPIVIDNMAKDLAPSPKIIEKMRELLDKVPDLKRRKQVRFSESDSCFIRQELAIMNGRMDIFNERTRTTLGNAYARVVENAVRLTCLYAIIENPVDPIFRLQKYKFFYNMIEAGVHNIIKIVIDKNAAAKN